MGLGGRNWDHGSASGFGDFPFLLLYPNLQDTWSTARPESESEAGVMLHSVEGIFRDGKVELLETPPDLKEARVIVTFLSPTSGPPHLTPEELAEARWRFATWEEDWNAPGMEAYDDYQAR
jgi:hypothetical protein